MLTGLPTGQALTHACLSRTVTKVQTAAMGSEHLDCLTVNLIAGTFVAARLALQGLNPMSLLGIQQTPSNPNRYGVKNPGDNQHELILMTEVLCKLKQFYWMRYSPFPKIAPSRQKHQLDQHHVNDCHN